MNLLPNSSVSVSRYGYAIFALGVLALCFHAIVFPYSGRIVADAASAAAGMGFVIVGSVLKKLEERLDKIERGRR